MPSYRTMSMIRAEIEAEIAAVSDDDLVEICCGQLVAVDGLTMDELDEEMELLDAVYGRTMAIAC